MPPSVPSKSDPLPNAAWIALDDDGTGTLKTVVGISNLDTATASTIGVTGRVYRALARTPIVNQRVFAAHANGIDAILTRSSGQPTEQNELVYPQGFGPPVAMTSGTTDENARRLFVVSADDLLAYEPTTSCTAESPCSPVDSVELDGDAVAVELSTDGRFVLVTRHPVGDEEDEAVTVVTTYDADTLDLVRENATAICESEPCDGPPPVPLTVAVDAGHALVSEPGTGRLAYLYLDAPRHRFEGWLLATAISATRDDAWLTSGAKESTLQIAQTASMLLELAEQATDPEARNALLRQAAGRLHDVRGRVDGCFGGDPADDELAGCGETAGIWHVTERLLGRMSRDLVVPPEVE